MDLLDRDVILDRHSAPRLSTHLHARAAVTVWSVRIEAVDERDSCWENDNPRFRVYLFDGGNEAAPSWAVETYDVQDADVLEVVSWAQEQAGSKRLFAVALVTEQRPDDDPVTAERGVIWLVGTDVNDSDARSRTAFQRMLRRRADAGR